jgi:hypothetical protein
MSACIHGLRHCPECMVEVGKIKPNIANGIFTMDVYLHACHYYISLEGESCDYDTGVIAGLFDKASMFALAVKLFEEG